MTAPAAGWYADPNGGTGLRFWNGSGWTDSTQPAPSMSPSYGHAAYGQPSFGQQAYAQPGYAQPANGQPPAPTSAARGTASVWLQNKSSLITVAICLVYAVIAGFSNFVFFGVLPVLYTVRSFQAKEPLAWVAAIATLATIGFSIWRYAG